ncbi:PEP-CTERM sorting domain-containing protein, partial [Synoicihabitans lomoniglobus]|nr:PEP-CTERM sorting domain-containing protein [Opitutaceae bacterium LMO-M01]
NGFTPADTIWLTYDYGANEITVPEPSSYGALLMAAALATHLLRRRHQQVGRARRARQHHATP